MYPQENLMKNRVPYEDQMQAVQTAVEKFQEDNGGILPIKTKEGTTPIYQKYPIDFTKIVPKYLSEPPGNAFESGGIFQYVLIDVETNPTVKLLDLRMAEAIRELNFRIQSKEYPPFKEQISEGVFSLDYSKLGYSEPPYVISPYTNQNLPFVITGDGMIFVDYRSDLYQMIKDKDLSLTSGDDIRPILVKDSFFVPAYSMPYTIDPETNEPIFLVK